MSLISNVSTRVEKLSRNPKMNRVLTGVAANYYADSTDQTKSIYVDLSESSAFTVTNLLFTQTADQTITFPDLGLASDTMMLSGTSGIAQTLANVTLSGPSMTLTTPLLVTQGGISAATLSSNGYLVGNGTATPSVLTLTDGQFVVGTGGVPFVGALLPGLGATTSTGPGTVTVSMKQAHLLSRTLFDSSSDFTNSTPSNILAQGTFAVSPSITLNTGANTCTIKGGTLAAGNVVYIVLSGTISNTAASRTITLNVSLGGTILHSGTMTVSTEGVTQIMVEAFIIVGLGSPSNCAGYMDFKNFNSTAGTVNLPTYTVPAFAVVNLANDQLLALNFQTATGTVTYSPDSTVVYVVKA